MTGGTAESAAVREAFGSLARSLKRISVFRHAREQHGQYLEPALTSLRELLERSASVTVTLEPSALRFNDEVVYTEPPREWGFCFHLHRDGVRALVFRRGISLEELLAFANVALADPQITSGREDAITELWKLDLRSIGYHAINGYRMDEAGGDAMSKAIAEIGARAQETLDKRVGDSFAEATVAPALWNDERRQKRDPENWVDLARRASLTILRIVELDYAGWDLEALEEAFWRLIDEMMERGEAQVVTGALDRARKLGGSHSAEFRAAVGKRLAEPKRLERAVQLQGTSERPPLLAAWLHLLPPDAGAAAVAALPLGATVTARAILASAALSRYESCATQLGELLRTASAPVAQAALAAAAGLPAARKAEMGALALGNPELPVMIDAMALVAADSPTAVKRLGPMLTHAVPAVRMAAAQALGGCNTLSDYASNLFIAAMARPQFSNADREEQAAFYRALGKLGSASGFSYLLERLARPPKKLFGRRKGEQEQLLAIQGLAEEGTQRSLRALEEATLPSRGHSAAVVAACRAAAQHLRTPKTRSGKTAT